MWVMGERFRSKSEPYRGYLFVPGPELIQFDIAEEDVDEWSKQLKVPPSPVVTGENQLNNNPGENNHE